MKALLIDRIRRAFLVKCEFQVKGEYYQKVIELFKLFTLLLELSSYQVHSYSFWIICLILDLLVI